MPKTIIASLVTYEDKVRKGDPAAIQGTTDTFRAKDANEIKAAINQHAGMLQDAYDTANDLFVQINPFKTTLSKSIANVLEIASSAKSMGVVLTWTCTVNGKAVLVDTLQLTRGATVLTNDTTARQFADSITVPTTPSTITWRLQTTYTERGNQSDDVSVSTQFVAASYAGSVSTLKPNASQITALTKYVRNTRGSTISNISLNNARFCYAYPTAFGALTSIVDQNNFQYINSFTRSTMTINGQQYYVYVLTNPTTVSSYRYTFS